MIKNNNLANSGDLVPRRLITLLRVMSNLAKHLKPFVFDPNEIREFERVLDNASLANLQQRANQLASFRDESGLYLWSLKLRGRHYKVYVGRTNSLQRRVAEYCRPFQPHSPNDFKLRVFESYVHQIEHSASLGLYFKRVSGRLQKEEAKAINKLGPLLNKLPKVDNHTISDLTRAFETYYIGSFKPKLDIDTQPADARRRPKGRS